MTAATADTPPRLAGWFRPGGNVWHWYEWDATRRTWLSSCSSSYQLGSGWMLLPYRDDMIRTCADCLAARVLT